MMFAWLSEDETGWNGLSVTIGTKGKVKVAGTLADGTKVSVSTSLIMGEEWCAVPVVYSKKGVNFNFMLWLSLDGGEMDVEGLDGVGDIVSGAADGEVDGSFCVSVDALAELIGDDTYIDLMPDGVPVVSNGKKWTVPKAGKVKVDRDGEIDWDAAGENPAGLKLTYKAKDGTFTGSFKVYTDRNGKPKATNVSVSGVVIDGKGYGAAMIKKVGSVAVTIE